MTAVDDRPRTTGIVKVFENLDVPEGFKVELLQGDADYRRQRITKFGDLTPMEPLDLDLDTSEFATYENVRPHRYP
ncbi:hypothetical protein ACGGAI_10880 [Streptomyces antibioticus]|uniref:hypothetical protein n=1 Tax=Streptomyces antibioticus TaxID=1890 RepID=UPI0037240AEF